VSTRDRLLGYLREGKRKWVSGELLSHKIGVSRSAIRKHIRRLREEGYGIESFPGKGYSLHEVSDLLLPPQIRHGLKTRVLGQKDIVYFVETDSTNTRAKALAARGAPEGTLVVSEKQEKGRGRLGRDWFSPQQEGIYASLILRPKIAPRDAPKITLLTAVAAADTLYSLTQLQVTIKWPNDLLVSRKKIAGILTESRANRDSVDYIVVGLGLNVNTASFPHAIREKATSILIETGKHYSRVRALREYLKWYEEYYEVFKGVGFQPLLEQWRKLTNTIGQQVTVEVNGKQYAGEAHDIDKDGALIIKDSKGGLHRISSADFTVALPPL
jgi:BirA family biotin operon repressor/biotin-[acetyl-CoA-carboxylase] ligase